MLSLWKVNQSNCCFRTSTMINTCDELKDFAVNTIQFLFDQLCPDQGNTFAETISEAVEAIQEAAPAIAAAGGSVAAAAMFAMPSLPMTLASGVPPGTKLNISILLKQFCVLPYFLSNVMQDKA